MIRKAMISDFDIVSELILMASTCLFKDILDSDDVLKHQNLLRDFYLCKDTKFYYENILVYEIDNLVVGAIVYYDSSKELTYNEKMNEIINVNYSFDIEAITNTTYIDSLAVNPAYQGKGIASKLIDAVINNSKQDVSLLVESYKEKTMMYYERIGFEKVKEVNFFNTILFQMLYHL